MRVWATLTRSHGTFRVSGFQIHLEPCRPSISKVGPSILLYYDIEGNPNTIKGFDKNGSLIYIISKQRLKTVFSRLRNRLSSLDSSTSTIEVTTEYTSHFYDMYIRQHDGKHKTGDRMKIPMLNLPFLMRDLLRPEVRYIVIILSIGYNIVPIIGPCICRYRVH